MYWRTNLSAFLLGAPTCCVAWVIGVRAARTQLTSNAAPLVEVVVSYVVYYLARPWRESDAQLLAELRAMVPGIPKRGVSVPIVFPHIDLIASAFPPGLNE